MQKDIKKVLYLECYAGISGDMFLASMIDLGVKRTTLSRELKKLDLKGYKLEVTKQKRHSIEATRFKVRTEQETKHRTFKTIKGIINKSTLKKSVKELAVEIFRNLALAEAKVHGIAPEKVHFHEVGAVDSIVDIVGAAVAYIELGSPELYASHIPTGSGTTNTMHGVMPIPAPATLELLRGIPLATSKVKKELTTPTGAAIIKTLSKGFGPMPEMSIISAGYGAGGKDFKEVANVLRAILGSATLSAPMEELFMVETNIDDMDGQNAGNLIECLLENGAVDAYITPVIMKKGRPGMLISALVNESKLDTTADVLFKESTTIGVRYFPLKRQCLERKTMKLKTKYGAITVKISSKNNEVINIKPEFDECKKVAKKKNVPIKTVIAATMAAALKIN
ncbi:MAG: nickel pincer cofactor biosynthesis protein LarC [Deltaproteobacteria bacterium]|nr:nickel pincer cofactor biosynthesis protein LarC [Deltaproteobacteria bacterium]